MKGSKLRAERNRQKVLQAALDLFQAQGIKKVAVNDIAAKAGVTPATVYNQFGSKDALVCEAVKEWYTRTLEDYRNILIADKPFEEKLQNIMLFKTTLAGKLHLEFVLATSSDDPEIRQFLKSQHMVEMQRNISNFFDEGREQDYINPEVSNESIMHFTEIVRKGINAEADLSEDPDYITKLIHELSPMIYYGIFGKSGKK